MNKHLSIRIAWHDNKWNGTVCNHPAQNTYCKHLPRILSEKNDTVEEQNAGKLWNEIQDTFLPPCKAEGGAFMNTMAYKRTFNHPYSRPNGKEIPHSALKPTTFTIPPFSSFAVPFWWMLKNNQKELRESYPDLPYDENPPFTSSWLYTAKAQNAVLQKFFDPIKENHSLAIYYVKGANPIDEDLRRLIAGIGVIKKKSSTLEYETKENHTFPLWDRLITHGINPNEPQSEGVLIPYQEYLDLPDDYLHKTKEGNKTKQDLLDEIKLTLQDTGSRQEIIEEFAYGSAWVNDSTMLIVLSKLRATVERIREHGIVKGHWTENLIWIDKQIGKVKENMGPFPSFANALIALGFQYAHSLESDLRNENKLDVKDNPWDNWEDLIFGNTTFFGKPYSKEFVHFKDIWATETQDRLNLLQLLSRFELSEKQIKNWFDPILRNRMGITVTDKEILENPYIIAEEDLGDADHYPIAVETIDNGLFEDFSIQGENSPPKPQLVESPLDNRRIRALISSILKVAATNGDTLVSVSEITERLNLLNLQRTTVIPTNYIKSSLDFIKLKIEHFNTEEIEALQLKIYAEIESYLRKILLARSKRQLDPLTEDWGNLIKKVIQKSEIDFNPNDNRHLAALEDQVTALEQVTSRKLSVLHGPAGTGKTTVLGALFGSKELMKEGILLLAPTGKARVKLGKMANAEALTIAQFLTKQNRFDWERMKIKFTGSEKYKGEQNVIIDECSMLTEEDLYGLLQAFDLAHIKRIILVGDPYQLPPIGAGRPFADLCNYIESIESSDEDKDAKQSLARLKEVVRTVQGENSDCLTLASWYSGLKPSKNADSVFSKLGDNDSMNDLRVENWQNEKELYNKINQTLVEVLGLKDENDSVTLNNFLGINGDKIDTSKIEAFQILTPVKSPFWGTFNLNQIIQSQFRKDLKSAAKIGDYKIGQYDKVIQTKNERKDANPGNQKHQISNGQLGVVKDTNKGYANVAFAGIEEAVTFGYRSQGQTETDESNIELAYTITVHKSQGSDFEYVFLVIPKTGRIISRELIYTALTRAKRKLILLIEGDSPHWIINLSKPQHSETSKRNTHMFRPSVRESKLHIPYVEGLIHKTKKEGLLVRSKSEVIISNELEYRELLFEYERELIGKKGQKRIPDFTFIDAAGDIIILEHLGMLSVPSYKADWEKKKQFYEDNGYHLNENLFITTESEKGGIDSKEIERVIDKIQNLL
ncbi:ATP-dependent RecD-like DNA helicase [Flavobacterium sp. LS1R47]|uniref:ATP-dependent RecD-like DNA helicase n=1 Tax=Flavobacterium frigoritolerans TaxID=2987686 RepID=A0A9X3C6Z9_9FLAO|nr:ATP-dependent RecD-like DNA helicase [Flavobacterium frigoritolerans]MCV9933029.1 ATP-dependent RecD-like DNA helicase [Flavobacterium frigoritolerans]